MMAPSPGSRNAAMASARPCEEPLAISTPEVPGSRPSRAALNERVVEATGRFQAMAVTRPPFWSGYRVVPHNMEFWTRDPHRLHERIVFERRDGRWTRSFLFP